MGGKPHPILASAIAGAGLRPGAFTRRLAGPTLDIAPEHLAALGVWCAEWVERGVPLAARAEFTESLRNARALLATGRTMARGSASGSYRSQHLSIARLASAAARRAVTNPGAAAVALCAAAKLVARLELAAGGALGELRARAFLDSLDDELSRLEADARVHEWADLDDPQSWVEAVLWRWAERGRVVHWLLRLGVGERRWYGLLSRSPRHWFEGSRDDVLSCVPDALFAEAVASAARREATSPAARGG